ncbi:hypothetical protein PSP6_170096 [Paraburkholderia tropica]|nr:hypothetical protein PSP6_170096 [Paraburkholderia tropica]
MGVRRTPRPSRRYSGSPNSSCNSRSCPDTAGCDRCSASAARLMLRCSATAANVISCSGVMASIYKVDLYFTSQMTIFHILISKLGLAHSLDTDLDNHYVHPIDHACTLTVIHTRPAERRVVRRAVRRRRHARRLAAGHRQSGLEPADRRHRRGGHLRQRAARRHAGKLGRRHQLLGA